jgi:hypothetical protein
MIEKGRRFEPNQVTRSDFMSKLAEVGIRVPNPPNNSRFYPEQFLFRGENKFPPSSRHSFSPNSGEIGRYGVFMADCDYSSLYPNSGALYVIDRDSISENWVALFSEEYQLLLEEIAKENSLNLKKIGDGSKADTILAERYHVYDPKTGITTSPKELSFDSVEYVLITNDFFESHTIEDLPTELQNKVIFV